MGIFSFLLPRRDLRAQLFAAIDARDDARLVALCKKHHAEITQAADGWRKVPVELRSDMAKIEDYMQHCMTIARCMASLGHPEAMATFVGPVQENPFTKWEQAIERARKQIVDLEFDSAIADLRALLPSMEKYKGPTADHHSAIVCGMIGACFFHSGRAREAIPQMERALALCESAEDTEGIRVYLGNLADAHRYLGAFDVAATWVERLAAVLFQQDAMLAARERKRAQRIRAGEPLCRVVVVRGDERSELDELTPSPDGSYRFIYERNRPQILGASVLTHRGTELASKGDPQAALDYLLRAAAIDPFDPEPHYHAGMCLLELRRYEEACAELDQTEKVAPGWFHVRTDRWIAGELLRGAIEHDAFLTLRVLEDGNPQPLEALAIADRLLSKYETLALLWLFKGNALHALERKQDAEHAFRRGLSCATVADLESRLLLALANELADLQARTRVLEKAIALDGNLVATAMAKVMQVSALKS